jgi:hypothetical protein
MKSPRRGPTPKRLPRSVVAGDAATGARLLRSPTAPRQDQHGAGHRAETEIGTVPALSRAGADGTGTALRCLPRRCKFKAAPEPRRNRNGARAGRRGLELGRRGCGDADVATAQIRAVPVTILYSTRVANPLPYLRRQFAIYHSTICPLDWSLLHATVESRIPF